MVASIAWCFVEPLPARAWELGMGLDAAMYIITQCLHPTPDHSNRRHAMVNAMLTAPRYCSVPVGRVKVTKCNALLFSLNGSTYVA